jgi:hypothetical protein
MHMARPLVELGGSERIFAHLHEHFHGALTPACLVRVRGGILQQTPLERALAILQKRHPKLRARIVKGERARYFFEEMDEAPRIPMEIQTLGDDRDYWRLFIKQVNTLPFDTGKCPLMRVYVLNQHDGKSCDLILSWHHAIIDGPSAFTIVHELLTFYHAIVRGEGITPEPRTLVSEDLSRIHLGFFEQVKYAWRLIRSQARRVCSLPMESTHVCVQQLIYSEDEVNEMIYECRRQQTTLFGVLCAALMIAVAETVQELKGRSRLTVRGDFRLVAPVDLRPCLGHVEGEDLGCFIGTFRGDYPQPRCREELWPLARRCASEIAAYSKSRSGLRSLKFLETLTPLIKSPPRRPTLAVNNLGVYRFAERYGPLRVEEFVWSANIDQFGPDVSLLAVTVQDRLNLLIGGGLLGPRTTSSIKNKVANLIRHAQNQGSSMKY